MNSHMAQKLTELRIQRGLSQEALANLLGISRQSISNWERGEVSPDTENLILLSKLYGCTLDELVGNAHLTPDRPTDEEAPPHNCNSSSKKDSSEVGQTLRKITRGQRILALASACSLVIAIAAFTSSWSSANEARLPSAQHLEERGTDEVDKAKHSTFWLEGEITDVYVSHLGNQYAVKGIGEVDGETKPLEEGIYVFRTDEQSQFLDMTRNEMDNDYTALKEGATVRFTGQTDNGVPAAITHADTIQPIDYNNIVNQ